VMLQRRFDFQGNRSENRQGVGRGCASELRSAFPVCATFKNQLFISIGEER
jgi:hypothetical protein